MRSVNERSDSQEKGVELAVRQPERIRSLLVVLSDLEHIAERVSEESSTDMGGGGAVSGAGASAASGQQSSRQRALKSLPSTPVMRRRITTHMQREIHDLEVRARKLMRSSRQGSAYLLNELYARIRKIQSFIYELIDVAEDIVKTLYIRLFIDLQEIV